MNDSAQVKETLMEQLKILHESSKLVFEHGYSELFAQNLGILSEAMANITERLFGLLDE